MDVYVLKDGRRTGPYQPFLLSEMLEDGSLTPLDVVWHEGMEKWQTLEETESLRTVLRGASPPVATQGDASVPPPPAAALPPELTMAVLRARRGMAWRRFFARQIDLTLAAVFVIGTAAAAGWTDVWALHYPASLLLLMLPAGVWVLLETAMLSLWCWTPGRLVLALRVTALDGGRASFVALLKRSVLVWAGGMGCGLRPAHLLPVAQWLYSFWHYQRRGQTLWDHAAGTSVTVAPLQRRHAAGVAFLTAAFAALSAAIWFLAPLPDRITGEERQAFEQLRRAAWQVAAPAGSKPG